MLNFQNCASLRQMSLARGPHRNQALEKDPVRDFGLRAMPGEWLSWELSAAHLPSACGLFSPEGVLAMYHNHHQTPFNGLKTLKMFSFILCFVKAPVLVKERELPSCIMWEIGSSVCLPLKQTFHESCFSVTFTPVSFEPGLSSGSAGQTCSLLGFPHCQQSFSFLWSSKSLPTRPPSF